MKARRNISQSHFASQRVLWLLLVLTVAAWTARPATAQASLQTGLETGPQTVQLMAALDTSDTLPDAPAPAVSENGTASLQGTVLDPNGNSVADARVVLTSKANGAVRTGTTNASGGFVFAKLPAGEYKLTVSAPTMADYVDDGIELKNGEAQEMPVIILGVAGTKTEVVVTASVEEVAQQQLDFQMDQRVLGVLPNFYTSYVWDASPLNAKQKFQLAFHSVRDPFAFVGYAFLAGIQQAADQYPGYGQGWQGYGKRYGAAFANDASGRMLGSAIYPTLFHQDPRYFYKGEGSRKSRALYAITRAFITRGDNGHSEFNFSKILGTFSAAAISNAYYPESDRGLGLTLTTGAVQTAGNAADNLVREFIFKRLTPNVPVTSAPKAPRGTRDQ